ncbi:MAG: phosphatase, partial [Planctomycetia bacterium]|nr:phosphatase [Planctomycetia bacterium]
MLAKTQALGSAITEAEMEYAARESYWPETWTGEMFAEVLLSKAEYASHERLRPYRAGGARDDNPLVNFYWDFYSQGKPCHVEIHYPPMR